MMKYIDQYRGLQRDIYIIFIGRIVGSLGTFIWPLMSLILSVKFGYGAQTIALVMGLGGIISLPASLIGGKLADRFGRKPIILLSTYMVVASYFINAFTPLSNVTIGLFFVAAFFGNLQGPAYDAMIADKSTSEQRSKAYSLSYMGFNLGFILGPSIGGFLFKDLLWLAFLIDGTTTLIGAILIHIYVSENKHSKLENLNVYEQAQEHKSTFRLLIENKTLFYYLIIGSIGGLMYTQMNFLLPIQLSKTVPNYDIIYGFMFSLNGLIVIIFTPLFTYWLKHKNEIYKIGLAYVFEMIAFAIYAYFNAPVAMFFLGMIIFTWGEIAATIAGTSYFTRRIPSSHRGRLSATIGVSSSILVALGQIGFGRVIDLAGYLTAWTVIICLGMVNLLILIPFQRSDRKNYSLLKENLET